MPKADEIHLHTTFINIHILKYIHNPQGLVYKHTRINALVHTSTNTIYKPRYRHIYIHNIYGFIH